MAHRSFLDREIFQAIAGHSFQIPAVGSIVYYFPQGHLEHSSATTPSNVSSHSPFFRCQVIAVDLLANPDTDEVFTRICLQPVLPSRDRPLPVPHAEASGEKNIVSFTKILTPSDANNGGGFSVPRFCADSIFPPLDFEADPPVQTITIKDVHGVPYEFRHIYRGTPRRHLLTTGWSRFVNNKKLVAGDSVVFMRNNCTGELFMGLRRTVRSCGSSAGGYLQLNCEELKDGFSRSGKGRVPVESVAEAVKLAGNGRRFEVVYYPKVGSGDFVVRAEVVEEAMKIHWTVGMRIKLAVETDDSARMAWYQGTVSSVDATDGGSWQGSPWHILQVTWDEPDVLPNVKRVSPWLVELVPTGPHIPTPFLPAKRVKFPRSPDLQTDGGSRSLFPMTGLTDIMMGHSNPSPFSYNTFPAGMQGARHDPYYVSTLTKFIPKSHHLPSGNLYNNKMSPEMSHVSTELNIGGKSHSENPSPQSQGIVDYFRPDPFCNRTCKTTKKAGGGSIQLFGQTILAKNPDESGGFDSDVHADNNVSKGYKETHGMGGSLDFSLSYPYKQLYDRLDVQCQRMSAVGACSL